MLSRFLPPGIDPASIRIVCSHDGKARGRIWSRRSAGTSATTSGRTSSGRGPRGDGSRARRGTAGRRRPGWRGCPRPRRRTLRV